MYLESKVWRGGEADIRIKIYNLICLVPNVTKGIYIKVSYRISKLISK